MKSIDIKLIYPIFVGDTIKFTGKVIAKHPRKDKSFCEVELWAENQDNKKVAVGIAEVFIL